MVSRRHTTEKRNPKTAKSVLGNEMDESVEDRAIKMARRFFEKNGWAVEDVSHCRGDHAGYDLAISQGSKQLKVEVKGSEKLYCGIPDLYGTEVNRDKTLVADLLCVGYSPPGGVPKLAVLYRSDIPSTALVRKICYRIKPRYKNRKRIAEHLLGLNEHWVFQKRRGTSRKVYYYPTK